MLQDGDKSITHLGLLPIPNGMEHDGMPINFFRDNFQQSEMPDQKLFHLEPFAKAQSVTMDATRDGKEMMAEQIATVTRQLIRIVRERTGLAFVIDYLVFIDKWDSTIMATAFITEKTG